MFIINDVNNNYIRPLEWVEGLVQGEERLAAADTRGKDSEIKALSELDLRADRLHFI